MSVLARSRRATVHLGVVRSAAPFPTVPGSRCRESLVVRGAVPVSVSASRGFAEQPLSHFRRVLRELRDDIAAYTADALAGLIEVTAGQRTAGKETMRRRRGLLRGALVGGLVVVGSLAGVSAADATPVQQAYLKASNAEADDNFGWSVAVDGDTMVVGAPFEAGSATGGQGDNSAPSSGAAYVFTRTNTGSWTQQAYLKASNTEANDNFGWLGRRIDGDTVVVGAYGEDSSATGGQRRRQRDGACAGAAYVFVRSGGAGPSRPTSRPPTPRQDYFGQSRSRSPATRSSSAHTARPATPPASTATATTSAAMPARPTSSCATARLEPAGLPQGIQHRRRRLLRHLGRGLGRHGGRSARRGGQQRDRVNGNAATTALRTAGAAYVFVRNGGPGASRPI